MEYQWQTIAGSPPSKSNSYRIVTISGHGALAKTAATKAYENSFYMQVGPYRNLMIDGYFEIHVRAYFASMSHDIDNILKSTLDCLQYCKAIRNDNRCVKVTAEKFIDKTNPRIEFKITTIE